MTVSSLLSLAVDAGAQPEPQLGPEATATLHAVWASPQHGGLRLLT